MLTIHGVTQTVTFPLEAQLVDQTIVVVGSLDIEYRSAGAYMVDAIAAHNGSRSAQEKIEAAGGSLTQA